MHSFVAIDQGKTRQPSNAMIGRYKLYHSNGNRTPTLYMVNVDTITGPTIGIRDISPQIPVQDELYLFLFLRKEEWASSWDSMITSCHTDRHKPAREPEYKKRVRLKDSCENGRNADDDNEDEDNDEDEDEDEGKDEDKDDDEDNDEGEDENEDKDDDHSISDDDSIEEDNEMMMEMK